MSTLARKLKLSVNPDMINKNERDDRSLFTRGWENTELTAAELAEWVKAGRAFCAQVVEPRKAANFLASDVIAVDVDGTRTIEDALEDDIVKRHATLIYTTARHTQDEHRFRIVFALPRTITEPKEMSSAARALALRLAGDRSAVDATRISFGSKGAQTWLFDREISVALLDDLIAQGTNPPQIEFTGSGQIEGAARSGLRLLPSQVVRVADGSEHPISEIPPKTPIHCPFHHDSDPSAFIVKSERTGTKGIHCSTCGETYWPAQDDDDTFEFREFEAAAKRVQAYFKEHEDVGPLAPIFGLTRDHPGLVKSNINFVTGAPAPPELLPGLTFITSPKGSGKTGALKRLTSGKKVLLIGHRQALIRQSCLRLELECYLDDRPGNQVDRSRYGICLDSLLKIRRDAKYDVVVLDESQQLFTHFLSDTVERTLGGGRDRLFSHMREIIRHAKRVVALDADLGWVTFDTVSKMAGQPEGKHHLWFNEDPASARQKLIHVYGNEAHLKAELMQAAADGKRCYVASNNKKKIDEIAEAIGAKLPDVRQIKVTSDTGKTQEVRDFVENISERALDYDVILASPTMGTGVDITFPERQRFIDVVFGFCDAQITTHFDFDQQIGRVRDPGDVRVWVTPRRFHFETNEDAVRYDIMARALYKNVLVGYGDDGAPLYRPDAFIDMAAQITSLRRASMNDLKRNFIRHKRQHGFQVEFVKQDEDARFAGLELARLGRGLRKEEIIARLIDAAPLHKRDYVELREQLDSGETLSKQALASMQRTAMEIFYRQPVSKKLIEQDEQGKYRRRVEMFDHVTGFSAVAQFASVGGEFGPKSRFVSSTGDRALAIIRLLERTAYLRRIQKPASRSWYQFDATVTVDESEVAEFVAFARSNKPQIENLLGIEIGSQLLDKPMRVVGQVLKFVGLKQIKKCTKKEKGKKIYTYRLDPQALAAVSEIVAARKARDGWSFVHSLHGWPRPETDAEKESDRFDSAA